MALTSIHLSMTHSILKDLGFSTEAQRIAAAANEEVDDAIHQGPTMDQANLHGMGGFKNNVMQNRSEAAETVKARLDSEKEKIVRSVRAGQIEPALKALGAALHTQQDKAYHRHEPWPFLGVGDAIVDFGKGLPHGLASDYMVCHGIRDLSYVSAFGYGAQYNSTAGWASTARVELTLPSRSSWMPHMSAGIFYQQGGSGPGQEVAAYGLLTWGAVPGSVEYKFPDSGSIPGGISAFNRTPQMGPETSQGPESLLQAERNSRDYVLEIKAALSGEEWARFKNFRVVSTKDVP